MLIFGNISPEQAVHDRQHLGEELCRQNILHCPNNRTKWNGQWCKWDAYTVIAIIALTIKRRLVCPLPGMTCWEGRSNSKQNARRECERRHIYLDWRTLAGILIVGAQSSRMQPSTLHWQALNNTKCETVSRNSARRGWEQRYGRSAQFNRQMVTSF